MKFIRFGEITAHPREVSEAAKAGSLSHTACSELLADRECLDVVLFRFFNTIALPINVSTVVQRLRDRQTIRIKRLANLKRLFAILNRCAEVALVSLG